LVAAAWQARAAPLIPLCCRTHDNQLESRFTYSRTSGFTVTINGSGLLSVATVLIGNTVLATAFLNADRADRLPGSQGNRHPSEPADGSCESRRNRLELFGPFVVSSAAPTTSSPEPRTPWRSYIHFPRSRWPSPGADSARLWVQCNGFALATAFVSLTRLTTAVPTALLTAPGDRNDHYFQPGRLYTLRVQPRDRFA
jgi:hypothetical protein